MLSKKTATNEKISLHPRNQHRGRYNFKQLVKTCPALAPFVLRHQNKEESINFFDPAAVKMLNKALLLHAYEITDWDIPDGYLCPPIPGRADYIHYIADLLAGDKPAKARSKVPVKCLDIGVGANCIYPLIGNKTYGWQFVGTDIDKVAIAAASRIVGHNNLENQIELRHQAHAKNIFAGIIRSGEHFDATICNPPFHSSKAAAQAGSMRKLGNLTGQKPAKPVLNFAGKSNELWCDGGEERFIQTMILQSRQYAEACTWFTTLVAKSTHLPSIYHTLKQVEAAEVKTIPMAQGNKVSRIVAWRFGSKPAITTQPV